MIPKLLLIILLAAIVPLAYLPSPGLCLPAHLGTVEVAPGEVAVGEIILDAGNLGAEISLATQGPVYEWVLGLDKNPNIMKGTLVVNAGGRWQVTASPDPSTSGHMAEYDSAISHFVPGGRRLKNPVIIRAENGYEIDLSRGGVLVEGEGRQSIPLTFEQEIDLDDEPLPEGRVYQMALVLRVSGGQGD